jgi:hypothetical protein
LIDENEFSLMAHLNYNYDSNYLYLYNNYNLMSLLDFAIKKEVKMNKRFLLTIIITSLLLAGCGKVTQTNPAQQNAQSPLVAATITTSDTIDYNQYIKKTWIERKGTSNFSFCITNIISGKITGRFTTNIPAVPDKYDLGNFTGTIDKDTAECQFSDKSGNMGNIKLFFKPNGEMEVTLKLTDKSKSIKERPQEGTFQFIPYNLNDIKGFSLIKDQSFIVDLNSWGNVNFVSGKLTGGNHIPVEFYLTNKDSDILYDFDATLPYSVDVTAISFVDVNKDELKDIIIIVTDNYDGSGSKIATVYLQKTDGSFTNDDPKLNGINKSGNNKDIKTVIDYLSKKF